ncbi:hypothetical protein [Vibrio sp. WXL210]|uniref:hypothetical protein n=1 Tax=Vibrio sp. WXL210 TaxID=3450709 RepID=UPI003EC590B9
MSDYLTHSGFDVDIITDGAKVIDWVKQHNPELNLLDLMLPHKGGLREFSQVLGDHSDGQNR